MSVLIKGMEMPQSCYDCPFQHPCKHDEDKDYCVVIDDFLYFYNMEANNCPLIEVPTHGRWIDIDDSYYGINYRCSVCDKTTALAKSYDILGNEHQYPYCPRCGAKMDGGDA